MNSESRLKIDYMKDSNYSSCATFILHSEDYTIGNSLRDVIVKFNNVEFCGYCIPHPSDNVVNIRIQTFNVPTENIFHDGLKDLRNISQIIHELFILCLDKL